MFLTRLVELAAEYGTREDVEILFLFTSPVSTVANWSVDGIISHLKMEIKQLESTVSPSHASNSSYYELPRMKIL